MWLDEFYDVTILALSRTAARFSDWMDRNVWDGIVRAFGGSARLLGGLTRGFDDHAISAGVDDGAATARGIGRWMSSIHNGQIQLYMGAGAIGMVGLLLLYAWLG